MLYDISKLNALDEHLIVDHGVDARLIGATRRLCKDNEKDYDFVAEKSHELMHGLDKDVNHEHD